MPLHQREHAQKLRAARQLHLMEAMAIALNHRS